MKLYEWRMMREEILQKTHRGFDVYKHIIYLRTGKQVKTVPIVGRPVVVPNPWDGGNESLVLTLRPTINNQITMHHDESGTLEDGNCFDFARKHYEVDCEHECKVINEAMMLHVGEAYNVKLGAFVPQILTNDEWKIEEEEASKKVFSYFRYPVWNTKPDASASLVQVYRMIIGHYYKERTERLRATTDVAARKKIKETDFCFCTFSGVFSYRSASKIVKHSGLICMDFDHVDDVWDVRHTLLKDPYFTTELMFTSVSGDGVKWIIDAPKLSAEKHSYYVEAICNYLEVTYGLKADRAAKDLARACNLAWDPECYINPELITNYELRNPN